MNRMSGQKKKKLDMRGLKRMLAEVRRKGHISDHDYMHVLIGSLLGWHDEESPDVSLNIFL